MKSSLTAAFLDLGDATSRNLEFSQRADARVSYGDETITEPNLLEIRRRHPGHVRVIAFSKPREAKNGADWEWRVVGLKRTLKMRVQAKRLHRDGPLQHRPGPAYSVITTDQPDSLRSNPAASLRRNPATQRVTPLGL